MNMRRAARKDTNHNEIAKEFESFGWVVLDLSQLKKCCDMAVAKDGITIMIEVKDGSLPPSRKQLTEGEAEFRDMWLQGGNWQLVECVEDVQAIDKNLEVLGV